MKMDRFLDARKGFQAAVDIDPKFSQAIANLGAPSTATHSKKETAESGRPKRQTARPKRQRGRPKLRPVAGWQVWR